MIRLCFKRVWEFMKRKKLAYVAGVMAVLGVVLGIVLLLSAPTADDGVAYLIGVSHPNMTDNFQLELNHDIETRCQQYDSVRFVSFDAGHNDEKQKQDISNLIELGVDALVVVTFEPDEIAEAITKAYDTGIPVIIIGYAPEHASYTSRIYTDNVTIGQMAGEYVKKLSSGRICTVLEIQGEPHSKVSVDLKNGFFEGIAPHKNITKEYVMTGYWSQEKTRARMYESDFFSKEPPINVIFAHNDMMALGAAVNLRQTRKSAYIISVGGYSIKNSDLLAIKDGMINATIAHPTGGAVAVDIVMNILQGEDVPSEIELIPKLVYENNVDIYIKTGGAS